MPRALTGLQVTVLQDVEQNPGTTIQEVADRTGRPYSSAQQCLARMVSTERIRLERERNGGYHLNHYFAWEGADPDSADPLERLYAAPAYDGEHP